MRRPWAAALLWLALGGPAAAGEGRPLVAEVALRLPPGEEASALEGLVEVKSGQPLAPRALRRTVQALFQLGRFANVVVRVRPAPAGAGGAPAVAVEVECLPKRIIAAVTFEVDRAVPDLDDERLRRVASLAVGDELYPDRLAASVEAVRVAYGRRGYREAEVEAKESGDREVAVDLRVRVGPPTRVASLALGAVPGLAEEALGRGLRTRPGAILDLDALEADVRDLQARLRQAGYYRGRVEAPRVEVRQGGAAVAISVAPGPRVVFRFAGNAAFDDRTLARNLGYDPETPLDAAAVEAAAERLRAFMQERGYLEARVAPEERSGEGWSAILFHVEEGRRYRVETVRFIGPSFRDEGWLRSRLLEGLSGDVPAARPRDRAELDALAEASGAPAARPARSALDYDPRYEYYEPAWTRAVAQIVEIYRDDGFLDATHEATRLTLDARRGVVDVEIRLREGVRTSVESIAFEGNRAVPLQELAAESRLAPGAPLSPSRAEKTRIALLDLYARRGYLYARVEEREEFSADRRAAAVRYRVDEGPRVFIGKVFVSGAQRTREGVIRDTLTVAPGAPYDPEAVTASQSALLRLGVFRSVGLRLDDPEIPEGTKDLTVDVSERPWQTLAVGGGFSIADGPRLSVEYGRPNLFGEAVELTVRGKLNYPLPYSYSFVRPDLAQMPPLDRLEGRGDVGLRYPRIQFLPFPMGASLDAVAERLHRPAYDLGRVSTIFGLDLPVSSRIGVGVQYEFEVDNIRQSPGLAAFAPFAITQADVEQLRFPEGVTTLQSVRPYFTLDFRDSSVHPRRGFYASTTLDYSHSIGSAGQAVVGVLPGSDFFVDMLKVTSLVTGYVPFGSQSVLALSLRAGRVFALSPNSVTIGPKRFFLGGAATMRGYYEDGMVPEDRRAALADDVRRCATLVTAVGCSPDFRAQVLAGDPVPSEGGQAMVLLKAELRVPLAGSLEAGFFADAGNLWLDPRSVSLADIRLNLGMGLRVLTPIGPAVFDLGFNVQPDQRLNEPTMVPHFAIGLF